MFSERGAKREGLDKMGEGPTSPGPSNEKQRYKNTKEEWLGGVQKSVDHKAPWNTGMLIYLLVTSRPPI